MITIIYDITDNRKGYSRNHSEITFENILNKSVILYPESLITLPKKQFEYGIDLCKYQEIHNDRTVITLSDHILNGIRVGVKQKLIKPKDIEIRFICDGQEDDEIYENILSFDEKGGIDVWPDGFLDQWEKELEQLF